MGTISERKRKNGTKAYTAQIRIKRDGVLVHSEAQTFDRRPVANAWLKKRETELDQPGALDKLKTPDVTLAAAIQKYIEESVKEIGKTKAQCLRMIKKHAIADKRCSEITSVDIAAFATDMKTGWLPEDADPDLRADVQQVGEAKERLPQTVGNYMSHLGAVFAVARPMWGYKLDKIAFDDAFTVTKRLGITSRSKERDRRPTLSELDRLLTYFAERNVRTPQSMPMGQAILFAIFSARRQEEITRLLWTDYEPEHGRILVRDMKHPGQKIGNDVWCTLTTEAIAVIQAMPRSKAEIFPYNSNTISRNFTDACKVLGIDDLHYHDLRHDGVSRLFEIGWDIPRAATVSGHRSWSSLKRYTHIRQTGDKYAGWKWLPHMRDAGAETPANLG
ncbi:chorismate mutase [Rhizobium sp. Root1203]|uniref:site-specific integrase n=1 Tax=Rhizobium sp. Root1203 TaxID=1736427 RepID=UPI00070DADFF|nr:site-specific integrase [Rhizobium sp. Root1203]KQV27622.1 chorismate mutase [Rhizobium sp. Root1203]